MFFLSLSYHTLDFFVHIFIVLKYFFVYPSDYFSFVDASDLLPLTKKYKKIYNTRKKSELIKGMLFHLFCYSLWPVHLMDLFLFAIILSTRTSYTYFGIKPCFVKKKLRIFTFIHYGANFGIFYAICHLFCIF